MYNSPLFAKCTSSVCTLGVVSIDVGCNSPDTMSIEIHGCESDGASFGTELYCAAPCAASPNPARRVSAHSGYDLLARLVQASAVQSFESAIRAHICKEHPPEANARLSRDMLLLRQAGARANGQARQGAVGREEKTAFTAKAPNLPFFPLVRPMTRSPPYRKRATPPPFVPRNVWARPSDQRKKASPTAGLKPEGNGTSGDRYHDNDHHH